MRASNCVFTVSDWHLVLCDTIFGAWVRRWGLCNGRGTLVSRCAGSLLFVPFRCNDEVEVEKNFSTAARRFDTQFLPQLGPSLSTSMVRLGASISPKGSISAPVTETSRFVCIGMPVEF